MKEEKIEEVQKAIIFRIIDLIQNITNSTFIH